jgi:hypothetical protein
MVEHHSHETLYLILLMSVGAGLVMAGHHFEHKLLHAWWPGPLGGLGDAFFIAGVLGLIVDRGLKTALTKDALSFMVGWEVPETIRESVKDLIRLPSVRKGFTITYDIADCETIPGFVRLTSVAEFSVYNLTPRRFDYQFRSRVEHTRFESVRTAKLSNAILEMRICESKSDPGNSVFESPSTQILDTTDSIERMLPTRISARGERWFKTKREQYFPDNFFAVLDLLPPACEGITVKIRAPTAFAVDTFFGTDEQPERQRIGDLDVWVSTQVHLPGQHLRITWSRRLVH